MLIVDHDIVSMLFAKLDQQSSTKAKMISLCALLMI